ncbi:glycerol kinase [Pelagibius litoralis]|uniref:ATP:glycerol 3-phosphotransferase n=1 Tax=Pelagibius litoralis TaxID=374515 RepID=A0A967K9B3_9PROT|nr:FGGY family carbohydrate kinase [Pelagibius litoralis]NIA69224.1 glycerol kinase [Pelagibius litoralis]
MSVLAIDQGTTSTRGLLLADGRAPRILRSVEHAQIYPQPGWVEHDPEELIRNILLCAESAGEGVEAIGIDNQGESCLAWDGETKAAISPVIVWQDNRTQPAVDRLKAEGAETLVLEKAGLPLDSYFSASKLAWILQNIPEAKQLSAQGRLRLGTTDAFFLDRLTGHCVTDITTASRTSLMNLSTGDWDEALCSLFGVPGEALPRIVASTGDFGAIRLNGRAVPVTASIVDQQGALYGHGCRAAGDAKVTFGTGAFALMVTGSEIHRAPEKGLLPTVAWQKQGEAPVYGLDGGVYCASAAMNWARGLGLFAEFDEIDAFDGPSAIERGLAFVPALAGLACPHWDRKARGLWIGMTLETGKGDLVRAILEGVAFRAAEVLTAMDERVTIAGPLSVDGGMAANGYFLQTLADILQRDLVVPRGAELTAIGTARLAAEALGPVSEEPDDALVVRPRADLGRHRARFARAVELCRAW